MNDRLYNQIPNGFGFVVNENAAFVTGGTGRLILGRNRVICFYS